MYQKRRGAIKFSAEVLFTMTPATVLFTKKCLQSDANRRLFVFVVAWAVAGSSGQ
jgi:hypothetical protein